MKRYTAFRLCTFVLVTLLIGCRQPHFQDRDLAVRYLESHRQEFEEIAESWVVRRTEHASCFCNFEPLSNHYRWGDTFIRKFDGGFKLVNDGSQVEVKNLEEASKWIGVPFAAFSYWVQMTKNYKIYCIEDDIDSTVQILLDGSDWSPYGFRYAGKENKKGLETLQFYARQGRMDNGDRRMEPIFGRWFYFEAKR